MYLVHFWVKLGGEASHEGNLSWLCLDVLLEGAGFPLGTGGCGVCAVGAVWNWM